MYLPSKKDYPDYYKVITDPIDLSIIEGKIKGNKVRLQMIIILYSGLIFTGESVLYIKFEKIQYFCKKRM